MMSILIKGMKMPEKCGSCDLFHVESPMHCTVVKGHKTVGAPYGMPRPDWCPLVGVPEPHGRLIDYDWVVENVIKKLGIKDKQYLLQAEKALMILVDEAPTVIEGSED